MEWCIYQLGPLQRHWQHLSTVAELAGQLAAQEATTTVRQGAADTQSTVNYRQFMADWEAAKVLAAEAGWGGDLYHDPVVFWIPMHGEFFYGFAFKQKDQAVTYVVSPASLQHLDGPC